MSDYYNVYRQRLNRYGLDFQSRIQGTREKEFENYLYKTIYRVDFQYNGKLIPGSLERYKQDYSETQGYLLTRKEDVIPNGFVLEIESQDGRKTPWMVWWLEQIEASGYNKYVVLKMTHLLEWTDGEEVFSQWAFFSGPGTSAITDAIKSSSGAPVYQENNNLHTFITTQHNSLIRDMYFEVTYKDITQGYVITEFDINSTPGVIYVTVDPVPLRDKTPKIAEDAVETTETYWLMGGYNK